MNAPLELPERREGGTLPPLDVSTGTALPPRARGFQPPKPSAGWVVLRLLAWSSAWLWLMVGVFADAVRGRLTVRRRAVHARRALERMGDTAVKIGQQVAMRLDAIPLELANELALLVDVAEPMDFDYAVARIRLAVGGDLSAVFEALDPVPIQSDSIACVYQAVLRDGTKVAVKVRRRDVAEKLAADRLVLQVLTRALSPLLGKSELLEHVLDELPQLLFENLDYVRVARLQRIFRRQAKRTGMKYVTAADVHVRLCSEDVIVSEFVSGVWLSEVIAAEENGDEAALAKLAALDIHPAECGRRLLHICWWGFFENFFVCELPSPSHIVVRPGGQLVFVDLGDTSILERGERKRMLTLLERLADHDVDGAVSMLVQLLQPLPYIDVHEFSKRAESAVFARLAAMENAEAALQDRSSAGLWVSLLRLVQDYSIPIRLDISRMIQAMCVYDHMAGRLWPRMRVLKTFKHYLRRSQRRNARRVLERLQRTSRSSGEALSPWSRIGQFADLMRRANLWLESAVESVPVQFIALSSKGSHSVSEVIRALALAFEVALFGTVAKIVHDLWQHRTTDVYAALRWVLAQRAFVAVMAVVVMLTIRRIMLRLDDMDHD